MSQCDQCGKTILDFADFSKENIFNSDGGIFRGKPYCCDCIVNSSEKLENNEDYLRIFKRR